MKKFEFKPTQFVLVRDNDQEEWVLSIYSHRDIDGTDYCGDRCEWKHIIPYDGNEHLIGTMDDYKEPYEPKDGDFVYYEYRDGCKYVSIFKKPNKGLEDSYAHLLIGGVTTVEDAFCTNYKVRRAATEEEKQLLLSKLHENGKDWDEEKKEIIEWKWKPNYGEIYYYPSFKLLGCSFDFNTSAWRNDSLDFNRMKINFVFKTEEECQAMCKKLNAAIKKVK